MRVSGAELALVIFTGMRLMLDAYLGGLSLKNLTVEEYGVRTDIAGTGGELGPLAVRPSHKNLGIGRELVRIALAAAERNGSSAVLQVGDPPYYAPLGFKPTRPGALSMPGPFDTRRLLAACYGGTDAMALEGEIRHRDRKLLAEM